MKPFKLILELNMCPADGIASQAITFRAWLCFNSFLKRDISKTVINKSTPNQEHEGVSLYWLVIPAQTSSHRKVTLTTVPRLWHPALALSSGKHQPWEVIDHPTVMFSRPVLYRELNHSKSFSNLGKQKVGKVFFYNVKCKSLHKIIACLRNVSILLFSAPVSFIQSV